MRALRRACSTLGAGLLADRRRAACCSRRQGVHAELLPRPVLRVPADRPGRRRLVPAAADDRHVRRAARATPGSRRASSTCRCSCSARSAWRRSARSPPTTPRRSTASGHSLASALTGGYHLAYLVGAGAVAVGVAIAFAVLRPPGRRRCPSRTTPPSSWPTPRASSRRRRRDARPQHRGPAALPPGAAGPGRPGRAAAARRVRRRAAPVGARRPAQRAAPRSRSSARLILPLGGLRQLGGEVDDARVLVGGRLALDVLLQLAHQLRRGRVALVAQHDHRAHDRAALLVGGGHRGGLGDRGVRDQRRLDLERADPVAGGDDHVVVAPLEVQPAVLVCAHRSPVRQGSPARRSSTLHAPSSPRRTCSPR